VIRRCPSRSASFEEEKPLVHDRACLAGGRLPPAEYASPVPAPIVDLPALRERVHVFADRADAGARLATLPGLKAGNDLVLAIPAGGVPVAVALAARLDLPLDVAVVSKITLPWNTEVGYGAVAFDGTIRLDERRLPFFNLSEREVAEGVRRTQEKVALRVARARPGAPALALQGKAVVLVDDGLASGFTMEVAVDAVRRAGAARVTVATPTGHAESAARVAAVADAVLCANLRSGPSFAVADAYRAWSDVSDDEVERLLAAAR
jgi:predicted phosphoribosyltransferase